MSFEKQHLRHCLLFTYNLNKNAAEAQKMVCAVLGKNAVSYSTCKKWFQRFKIGNYELQDEPRPGQPRKIEDNELEKLLEDNPTPAQLADTFGVTRQAVSKRLQKLGKVRKRAIELSDNPAHEKKNRNLEVANEHISQIDDSS